MPVDGDAESSSSNSSWLAERGEAWSACGALFPTSAAAVPAACRCCADRTRTDQEGARAGSDKDVRTCSQVGSDAGFGVPGCLSPPSGQCPCETGSQLQRITRSARSRPSLHGWARKQRIRTHSSSGELGGRAGTVPPSSSMGLGLLLRRRMPPSGACCGGGSTAKRRRRTMEKCTTRTFWQLEGCGGVCGVCLERGRRREQCSCWPCAWSVRRQSTGGAPQRRQRSRFANGRATLHEAYRGNTQPFPTTNTHGGGAKTGQHEAAAMMMIVLLVGPSKTLSRRPS